MFGVKLYFFFNERLNNSQFKGFGDIPWSLYHGVGLFSLIFLKRKGETVSKVLEKRESMRCAVGFAEKF